MKSFSREMAKFALEMRYEDLPPEVIHETKRIILDSMACGLAGHFCDRGKISVRFSERLGGKRESSIIGTSLKVSCPSAAFANGELINAIDFDAFEIPPGHFPPFVVPSSLAIGESLSVSGKALIQATAVGSEIGSRIAAALRPQLSISKGKAPVLLVSGQSFFIFGSVTAAAILMQLDVEKMTHAMGIAGHFCPVPNNRKFQVTAPSPMTRLTGWVAQSAVTGALLAEIGYLGDINVFDGEFGFWRMYAYDQWLPDIALNEIGRKWLFLNVGYKPYPCHRAMNTALDCFLNIKLDNDLAADDIESIRVFCNPSLIGQPASRLMDNHVDTQSNIPYNFACAALGIPVEEWQSRQTIENREVQDFMPRVIPDSPPDWAERIRKDSRNRWSGGVEVVAKGDTFKEEGTYPKGTAFSDAAMTDQDLEDKFRSAALKLLPQDKTENAIQNLFGLEKIENIKDVMTLVTN